MKMYISFLLIVVILLTANSINISAYANDLELEALITETNNGDDVHDDSQIEEGENMVAPTGIGSGSGNYVPADSVFLESFAAYYFSQLKVNFGENEEGTCSYVATAMLLSYYDTYWDDDIISDNYDQPVLNFDISTPFEDNQQSPGIKHESDNELSGKSYETAIAEHSNTHFHLELVRLGTQVLGMDYGISPWHIVTLLEHYLYAIKGYDSSQVLINYINWNDSENDKREYIKSQVIQGIPVIVSGGNLFASDPWEHTYIVYDYDEENDELYCHLGWHKYENTITGEEKEYTHIAFSSIGGTLIGGAITLEFNTEHVCSNNYVDANDKEYCSCFYEDHPAHECRYYKEYDETYHTYACDCSPSEENLFEHNFVAENIDKTYHRIYCSDCGYVEKTEIHTCVIIQEDDEYHNLVCVICGYTEKIEHFFLTYNTCYEKCRYCNYSRLVLEHDYTNSYDSKNNLYHYSYCVCGSKKLEEHNFYETDKSKLCYDCEYSIELNHVHSYTYTPNSNGRSHTKTCRCGISTSEVCKGMVSIGGDSYCRACGQKLNAILELLAIDDEEEILPLIKKEDEEYYE